MFGYISPVLNAFSPEQQQRYRSFYCGVCHALARKTGAAGRLTLSNDMTFLALLLDSLYEPDGEEYTARCAVHPLKTHSLVRSRVIDYAADMNLLLTYYKCHDQWSDDHAVSGIVGKHLLESTRNRLESSYPRQSAMVRNSLSDLWQEEQSSCPQPDRLCNLSGQMLGEIFVPDQEDFWAEELRSLGAGLGRFVYWMDAWEDYDEDLKKKRFNPLVVYHGRPDYEAFIRDTLEMLIAEATAHFETLPLEKHLDLLRNVLYSGAWQRFTLLEEKKRRKKQSHE